LANIARCLGARLGGRWPHEIIPRPQPHERATAAWFVAKSRLRDDQKDEILGVSDKNEYYIKAIFWHDLQAAEAAVSEFHNYLLYNSIFFTKDLYDAFNRIDDLLSDALIEQEIGTDAKDMQMKLKFYKTTRKEIEPLVKNLEERVQVRLHHAVA
jgi:hypothetical protein